MRRRMFPIAVLALGICTAVTAVTPGAAWGLVPVPRIGQSDARTEGTDGPEAPPAQEGAPQVAVDTPLPEGVRPPRDARPVETGPAPAADAVQEVAPPAPPPAGPASGHPASGGENTTPTETGSPGEEHPDGENPGVKRPIGEKPAENSQGGARKAMNSGDRAFRAACPPTSVICLENSLPGNPSSEWNIPGAGSSNIQGYATTISVNHGETIQFKVNTAATSYRIDIYRIGYYSGMGARKITTVNPSASLPQTQPACVNDAASQMVDCGNWGVSA